jgi:trans-AT polyketide synthase, acyltransferase and oxidoreductase domains
MSQTISPKKQHASTELMQKNSHQGWWRAAESGTGPFTESTQAVLHNLSEPVYIVNINGKQAFTNLGIVELGRSAREDGAEGLIAYAPATRLQDLGDKTFCQDHGISLPYMTGAMANGIASVNLVKAVANAGLLGSFGAAGLMVDRIEEAIIELKTSLGDKPFCANLIHSPNENGQEKAVVEIYLRHQIRLVEASAYMALTLPVVRYRVHGIHRDQQGNIKAPNNIIAKASRIEVAERWFSPPPAKFLQKLQEAGEITAEQAELAAQIPMAQDLSVEADSGGHTDNRPAITLIPTIVALRDRLQREYGYSKALRVGAAGGIATPASAAAAFSMGAAYIVTGTINQACIESGSSDLARQMLADAKQADVAMAPAVDMFEMGVKLQVLKRGTMFAMRGNKLYELYRNYEAIEDIPATELASLEKSLFKASAEEIWQNTRSFFLERDAEQVEKAEKDPKHKMALMFRWYLGLSSRWANAGVAERQVDYQIWCGPAMGAFNEWVKESLLEAPANRTVVSVALNIMYGAALVTRLNMLSHQGAVIASTDRDIRPQALEKIENTL